MFLQYRVVITSDIFRLFYLNETIFQLANMGANKSKDALRTEEVEYLMKQTNMDESTINQWYYGFVKDFPNGKMTQEKLHNMYKLLIPKGNPRKFCKYVFRAFDKDNDGHIDFGEFLLAINITSSANPEEKIRWAFNIYDIDRNGSITQDEFTKVIEAIYEMLGIATKNRGINAKEKAKQLFHELDTDSNSLVRVEEFVHVCMEDTDLKNLLVPEMTQDMQ